uniref:Transport and Golgi organization protein 1 homolog n=1 Tax=Melopsittacus undulatus TaxID=13146 RepID=A0A8C6JS58_MELUD
MAAAAPPDPRLLLALLLLLPLPYPFAAAGPGLGRRFAERKRCADPECSMLMCRGKAMQDFKGPDCRFVNFKKGEAVYVYYKLIGESTELWAGSVGSDFGYFPKDLLEINHNYSNEELELPTDETDFVCFDGGRDDFDNYNVDELLKSLQETIANEEGTESSDPGTNPAEGTERDGEMDQVDSVKSFDSLETDNLELRTEGEDAPSMIEELDSSLTEGTENTGGDASVSSHKENSQGDQIAHEHLKGMLHGKLKGLESENTKNTSIPQGETSQLDKESEDVDAYTLLNRELSVNLKTKFGSTADAVVSDDEVTGLVTSLEDDFNEDLSINAHDAEKEPDFADQSDEIPLLSFMAEEEIPSQVDLDYENDDIESQNHEPDEDAKGAAELNNQRDSKEEPDSDAIVHKDAFSMSKSLGDSIIMDRSESKQTEEKQDEVVLISKREAPAITQREDLSTELHKREPVGTGDLGSKGKPNKTEQFEEQLTVDGTESHSEELKSTAVPDPHVLPRPGEVVESKSFVKSNKDALKPPVDDISKSPGRMLLAQTEEDENRFEDDNLEEVLESNLKHKKLWEKTEEKGRAEDKSSIDVPAKPVEEVKNASQSDLRDADFLEEQLENGAPAVEKELRRHKEDVKQTDETDHENQKSISLNKEPEMKRRNMKETPAGEGEPSHRGSVEQPQPWENETEYSEAGVEEELTRKLGKTTVLEESIERRSPESNLKSTAQNTDTETLTQQRTARTGNSDTDTNLGTNLAKERTLRSELPSEEPGAEDDPDLKRVVEELLEDENAASAKLSRARAANVQGNMINIKGTNPELQVPSEAVLGTTSPPYETGEEIKPFSMEAKKHTSMQDISKIVKEEVDIPVSEDAKLDEMEHVMDNDDEVFFEAKESSAGEEHNFPSPDIEANNDFNQRKNHLPEDMSRKDSEKMQNSEHTRNDHHHSVHFYSPADSSAAPNDTATDFSESVKRLTIMRDFLDEKRITRLQKYLGLQHVVRIEAMFQDMKIEMELAQKASHNNEDIEKTLDQILEFSETSIMDFVGKVLDSRVAENKEEVVKEMDLYDEESALMDDIQELIYSLRSKYSSASESVPLASIPELEDDQLHIQVFNENIFIVANAVDFQLVATLPEEIRPGPDFHGLPWEPIIITALVGIATLAVIFWRTCLSVSIHHALTEKQLAEKIKNLLQEKTEILQKISEYDQKIKEAKESVKVTQEQNDVLSDETAGLKDTVKELEEANRQLDDKVKNLHTMLETERKKNEKKQNKVGSITLKSLEKLREAISVHSVELSEVQIALNEAKLSEEKVKSELHLVQEENARLKKSKEQLLKEAEGWSERHTELSEQIKLYQKSQKDIEEALAYKENEIEQDMSWKVGLAKELFKMKHCLWFKKKRSIYGAYCFSLQLLSPSFHLTFASPTEQIKKLEHDSCSLQSAKARLENECKTLQQKVEILGELYQQKEMALQKKLTQEEYERQEKEQKLSAADEKAVLAIEEVKVYKQRIQDMEEELQKTERSYKNQIAAHEKKAHDNWLIARSAERALAEEKREAANLRQKLIEVNQKIVMLQRPLIVKPTPGRPDRQVPPRRGPLSRDGSFGPSPVSGGNPSPTQMIEVPARPLSAPRREGSRGEFDLGPAVASLISSGPRTSSPSSAMDGLVS